MNFNVCNACSGKKVKTKVTGHFEWVRVDTGRASAITTIAAVVLALNGAFIAYIAVMERSMPRRMENLFSAWPAKYGLTVRPLFTKVQNGKQVFAFVDFRISYAEPANVIKVESWPQCPGNLQIDAEDSGSEVANAADAPTVP
jgi:hypothetical protein